MTDQHLDVANDDQVWLAIPARWIDRSEQNALPLKRARAWALVLEARSLECRIEQAGVGWQLVVPAALFETACRELRLYVEENRNWPPLPPQERPMVHNTLATISVLLLFAIFHNLIALDLVVGGQHPDWLEIGNAHASQILHGEWWRLVTALTLHADALHLFSNLAIGGIFIVYLCRDLGSGMAWSLILASGILGNLANAYVQLPSHSSVGFSTSIFGAVGLLGAVSMVRYRHQLRRRWPLPVAAALSLLALLGSEGKNTDLGAHLFGFLFGVILGLAAEFLVGRFGRPGRLLNTLLALGAFSLVIAAWWCAIAFAD